MTLGKAIEILTLIANQWANNYDDDDLHALNLGIEALKRIQEYRDGGIIITTYLLPGETKE